VGRSQRTKGAVFEREIRDHFSAAYGQKFERNIGQARDGGNDLDVGPLCVEVKRRKTLGTVYAWLQQAVAAVPAFVQRTGHEHPIPVVVARQDADTSPLVILRLSDFLALTRDEIVAHFEGEPAEPPAAPQRSCPSQFETANGERVRCQAGPNDHAAGHVGFITANGKAYRYQW